MEQTRLEKIAGELRTKKVDATIITSGVNRLYATGFNAGAGVCVIINDGSGYFLTDFRFIESAKATVCKAGYSVKMIAKQDNYQKEIAAICKHHGVKTLAYEDDFMTVAEFGLYNQSLPCQMCPMRTMLSRLRETKDVSEIESIVIAQRIAEKAFEATLNHIKIGMTEKQLAAELNYKMLCLGADGLSFDIIAVSGKNSSLPHGVPSDKKIDDGDFVTLDFGAMINGYHSDMTRTVAVGHATDEMLQVYSVVLKAQLAGINALREGESGEHVHNCALDIIASAGYADYFKHGLGHSVGLQLHEEPRAALGHSEIFRRGNVVTIEPGIYLPNKFGVRIEDMIWLSETGPKNLTNTKKELIVL